MDKPLSRMAAPLRWLAGLWLVGWALYVTFWDESRSIAIEDTMTELEALLIPAALMLAVSWALDRYVSPDRADNR
jgi:hypothetical protein